VTAAVVPHAVWAITHAVWAITLAVWATILVVWAITLVAYNYRLFKTVSAKELIYCIEEFATQQSNPVLSILPEGGILEMKHKYPDPMLSFSGMGLQAYYHCHTSATRPKAEHGHFHIFLNINETQWSHLAGLSMDNMGQPLQWFTVNHWVTGESWVNSMEMDNYLTKLLSKELSTVETVEKWILAMLGFYAPTLREILKERDGQIEALSQDIETTSVFNDRNIYLLSQQEIDLLKDLQYYLSHENQSQSSS
jgi:hypothetical protein